MVGWPGVGIGDVRFTSPIRHPRQVHRMSKIDPRWSSVVILDQRGCFTVRCMSVCIAPGSLDTSLSHAAGLSDIAVCHA